MYGSSRNPYVLRTDFYVNLLLKNLFDDRGTVHYIGDLDVVNKLKDMLKKLGVNEIDLENIDYINNKPIQY
jgi:hypothetical protein